MHRQHGDPLGFSEAAKLGRVDRAGVPAKAHFERDGDANGANRGADQIDGQRQIPHQMRSGVAGRHLFGGTAHIYIDDGGARILRYARGLGHRIGLAASDLHHVGRNAAALGFEPVGDIAARIGVGRDHFGDDERSPEPPGETTHGDIRDAGHRRQHGSTLDPHPTDLKALPAAA